MLGSSAEATKISGKMRTIRQKHRGEKLRHFDFVFIVSSLHRLPDFCVVLAGGAGTYLRSFRDARRPEGDELLPWCASVA